MEATGNFILGSFSRLIRGAALAGMLAASLSYAQMPLVFESAGSSLSAAGSGFRLTLRPQEAVVGDVHLRLGGLRLHAISSRFHCRATARKTF